MRDNGRWQLNDVQRFLVALAVTIALFLAAMSLGMQNIVLLLVALLFLVGAGLGVFMLGLRYNGRVALQGSAYVVTASPPPAGSIVGRCDMRLVVELPNASSKTVKHREPATPVIKWPRVGVILPIEMDPRNARQLRVRWELVEPHHTRVAAPAEQAAEYAVPFFTDYAESADVPSTYPDDATGPAADSPSDLAINTTALPDGNTVVSPPKPERRTDRSAEPHTNAAESDLPVRSIPAPRSAASDAGPPVPPARPSAETPGMGIMLLVSDLPRSLQFYGDLLNFSIIDEVVGSAVLSYGGGRILLRQVTEMSPVDRRVVHVHIPVSDLEAAYQGLRAKGVQFVHRPRVMSRGDKLELWAATFRDPDGHAIALTQWRDRDADASFGPTARS